MEEMFERSTRILGEEAIEKLKQARVAVFGLGGVGSMLTEALARAGVGTFLLVDGDRVSESNLNRQILATRETVGMEKTAAMRLRLHQIRPEIRVEEKVLFFLPEHAAEIDFSACDFVADAVDTVTAKIALAEQAKKAGVPIISCMGTGNRLDPSLLRVRDLFETSGCPLARVMRRELRRRGIERLATVCSEETPVSDGNRVPGSVPWVPPAAGLMMAGYIVRTLLSR